MASRRSRSSFRGKTNKKIIYIYIYIYIYTYIYIYIYTTTSVIIIMMIIVRVIVILITILNAHNHSGIILSVEGTASRRSRSSFRVMYHDLLMRLVVDSLSLVVASSLVVLRAS